MEKITKAYYMSFQLPQLYDERIHASAKQRTKQDEKKYMKLLYDYAVNDYLKNKESFPEDQGIPADPGGCGAARFISKSHSSGYVACVISSNPVGCDIEKIRTDWTGEDLKKRLSFFLNPNAQQAILSSCDPQKNAIIAWTRKESYFKLQQNRIIPAEFDITRTDEIICGRYYKFSSMEVDSGMILTCCTHVDSRVEWIRFLANPEGF